MILMPYNAEWSISQREANDGQTMNFEWEEMEKNLHVASVAHGIRAIVLRRAKK